MLVIRLQRTGRKGHAMFRIVVQDSRRTPTSGKVVAQVGNYDPHAKTINLDKDKIKHFLDNGAQPSERVTSLLKSQKVELPAWVKIATKKEGSVKNPDKRRSTAPAQPVEETPEEDSKEELAVAALNDETEQASSEEKAEE
jgi:small subunit ribosomal protein S16